MNHLLTSIYYRHVGSLTGPSGERDLHLNAYDDIAILLGEIERLSNELELAEAEAEVAHQDAASLEEQLLVANAMIATLRMRSA